MESREGDAIKFSLEGLSMEDLAKMVLLNEVDEKEVILSKGYSGESLLMFRALVEYSRYPSREQRKAFILEDPAAAYLPGEVLLQSVRDGIVGPEEFLSRFPDYRDDVKQVQDIKAEIEREIGKGTSVGVLLERYPDYSVTIRQALDTLKRRIIVEVERGADPHKYLKRYPDLFLPLASYIREWDASHQSGVPNKSNKEPSEPRTTPKPTISPEYLDSLIKDEEDVPGKSDMRRFLRPPSQGFFSSARRMIDLALSPMKRLIADTISTVTGSAMYDIGPDGEGEGTQVAVPFKERVYSALFAPSEVTIGEWFKVQVHLYGEGDLAKAKGKAREMDRSASLMEYNPLSLRIPYGTEVTIELSLWDKGVSCPKPVRTVRWIRMLSSTVFTLKVEDPSLGSISGEVTLYVKGVPVGDLSFVCDVKAGRANGIMAPGQAKAFRKAFISYSHQDYETATVMASSFRALKINYFFDHHSLETGAVFNEEIMRNIEDSDVFVLLWSEHSARSEYVRKEYTHAMKFAYPQTAHEKATLEFRPYVISPPAEPPEDLREIYNFSLINDRMWGASE